MAIGSLLKSKLKILLKHKGEKTMTTKKQQEQAYKKEAVVGLVVAILGWVVLGILEPIVLWRSIYIMNHTKVESTKIVAIWACMISAIATAVIAISVLIAASI